MDVEVIIQKGDKVMCEIEEGDYGGGQIIGPPPDRHDELVHQSVALVGDKWYRTSCSLLVYSNYNHAHMLKKDVFFDYCGEPDFKEYRGVTVEGLVFNTRFRGNDIRKLRTAEGDIKYYVEDLYDMNLIPKVMTKDDLVFLITQNGAIQFCNTKIGSVYFKRQIHGRINYVKLDERYYGDGVYTKEQRSKVMANGAVVLRGDHQDYLDVDLNPIDVLMGAPNQREEFTDIPRHTVPVFTKDGEMSVRVHSLQEALDKFKYIDKFGVLTVQGNVRNTEAVLKSKYEIEARQRGWMNHLEFMHSTKKGATAKIWDTDDENKAKFVNPLYWKEGGGVLLTEVKKPPIISKAFRRVGGKRYTWGIEYETSAGNLSDLDCQIGMFDKYGDRSINAFEYVTGIMSGNDGLEQIKTQTDLLSKKTLIDANCSTHIHIGGLNVGAIDSPSFNRQFSATAIKLGTLIEADLYRMMPITRHADMKHTRSIADFGDISLDDYKDYLAEYVFGGVRINGEWAEFDPDEDRARDIGDVRFGHRINSKAELNRFAPSRYKWLNLNHCNTNSRIKTIEFRMFSGTSSYEKVKNYLLICLAFVWAVENRRKKIWRGEYDLMELVREAYERYSGISQELAEFINNRNKKFNRRY
jgi:hypothetical protein